MRVLAACVAIAFGCAAPYRFVKAIPPRSPAEGVGTLEVPPSTPLLDFHKELLRVEGRPAGDLCVLSFQPCSAREDLGEYLITAGRNQACMYAYCGNRIDELLKLYVQTLNKELQWFYGQGESLYTVRTPSDKMSIEDVVKKFGPPPDQPMGTVVVGAYCEEPIASILHQVELLNRGHLAVLMFMRRNEGRSNSGLVDRCMYF
jgi:hypothetical protein